jgi:hypothetical protein
MSAQIMILVLGFFFGMSILASWLGQLTLALERSKWWLPVGLQWLSLGCRMESLRWLGLQWLSAGISILDGTRNGGVSQDRQG